MQRGAGSLWRVMSPHDVTSALMIERPFMSPDDVAYQQTLHFPSTGPRPAAPLPLAP